MDDLTPLLYLIIMQYQDMGWEYNAWEFAYLQEEAKKGLDQFSEACHAVLGDHLSSVLSSALLYAQEHNKKIYSTLNDYLDEEDACIAVILSHESALACKQICSMQIKDQGKLPAQSKALTVNAARYANAIRRKLYPLGILCPEVAK